MRQRTTLKASELGKSAINQARKKIGWTIDDDKWLNQANEIMRSKGVKGGVSQATWKRFLQAKVRIDAETFKVFSLVLNLHWEEIIEDESNSNKDLSEAPLLSSFYGRVKELNELEEWFQERCRLVVIHGMGGIGKKALARQLVERIANKYDCLIWRSLESLPPFQQFLTELIQFLSKEKNNQINISQLMQCLHQKKCFVVLDSWEEVTNNNIQDYSDYYDFFNRVAKESHRSSILLLSRERPRDIEPLEGTFVHLQKLGSLTYEESREILIAEGLSGTTDILEEFSRRYSNPWILKKVAKMVHTVFAGEVSDFVENTSVFVDNVITDFLDNQFQQLSELEKNVIYWIAIRRNTASWVQLVKDNSNYLNYEQLFRTLNYLIQGRSLVDKNLEQVPILFILEPVILKYVTTRFVEENVQQIIKVIDNRIIQGSELFISHSFITENPEDEELTQEQIRRIVKSIQENLLARLRSQQKVDDELRTILSQLQKQSTWQGYAGENISNLLKLYS
jgi:hypothetical protein